MPRLTDEQLEIGARMFGITIEEARRRNETMLAHHDNPDDPICIGCVKRPSEIPVYVMYADEEEISAVRYVQQNEGTFNWNNGHFLCDNCYISAGQPSSPTGWKAP